ncbi:NfeD family protein [Chloroflexota bacterium]
MTRTRLIVAIISTILEEIAIVVIWRWGLPHMDIYLSVNVLIAVMAGWLAYSAGVFWFVTRSLRRKLVTGLPTMVGSKGKAVSPLTPAGQVRIKGELWGAESVGENIDAGEPIVVVEEDGLKLVVQKAGGSKFQGGR